MKSRVYGWIFFCLLALGNYARGSFQTLIIKPGYDITFYISNPDYPSRNILNHYDGYATTFKLSGEFCRLSEIKSWSFRFETLNNLPITNYSKEFQGELCISALTLNGNASIEVSNLKARDYFSVYNPPSNISTASSTISRASQFQQQNFFRPEAMCAKDSNGQYSSLAFDAFKLMNDKVSVSKVFFDQNPKKTLGFGEYYCPKPNASPPVCPYPKSGKGHLGQDYVYGVYGQPVKHFFSGCFAKAGNTYGLGNYRLYHTVFDYSVAGYPAGHPFTIIMGHFVKELNLSNPISRFHIYDPEIPIYPSEPIGKMGASGIVTGAHVHFFMYQGFINHPDEGEAPLDFDGVIR